MVYYFISSHYHHHSPRSLHNKSHELLIPINKPDSFDFESLGLPVQTSCQYRQALALYIKNCLGQISIVLPSYFYKNLHFIPEAFHHKYLLVCALKSIEFIYIQISCVFLGFFNLLLCCS